MTWLRRVNLDALTNSELAERYFAANAEMRQLNEHLHRAENDYHSKPSPETLTQVFDAQMACKRGPHGDIYRIEIGRRLNAPLKAVRLEKGMSQGEIAKRAGLPRRTIQKIESGMYRANVQIAIRLWNVLGLEVPQEWESLDFS